MLDLPIPVKVLKYLRDNLGKGITKQEIADRIGAEPEFVERALEKLVEKEIVVKEDQTYAYYATPRTEGFSHKMLTLYEKIRRKPPKELFVRGIIASRVPLQLGMLLNTLEEEGLKREELLAFIEDEIQKGYIKKVKILYVEVEPFLIPFFRYYPRFRLIESDEFARIKEEYRKAGIELHEDIYLIGNYPPELARPAREYLNRERPDIKVRLMRHEKPAWFTKIL